jgi:protease-4
MKQFLKQTIASAIGTLTGLLLFLALGASGLVLLLLAVASHESAPVLKDKTVLVFDLSTQIGDTNPPASLSQVLAGETSKRLSLRQILDAIAKATQDERIVGIFLEGRGTEPDNGYATLTEVRKALQKFREAGKTIIAYDEDCSEKDYYLASVANTLMLNPMGMIEFNGLASQQVFLADALKKYGIGVQVVRVGSYKSAVEPFIRNNFSPQNREQLRSLLADLWGNFLSALSQSRQVPTQTLQAIADRQGMLGSEGALAAQLIDRAAYYDQVAAELRQLTGNASAKNQLFRQISLADYVEVPLKNARQRSSKQKIAIVYAEGTIVSGQGTIEQVGSDRFARLLRKLRQDKAVKAVVLRVNSPGGSATASDVILREVQLLRERKPVIVSMGNVVASGGYWISTQADRIFAEADTITGSIGVFGLLFNLEKIAQDNGINWQAIGTGELADMASITRPKTAQELAIYQKYVNQVYEIFLEKVAQSRKLPKTKVAQIAQGRVWSGKEAQKLGLVDRLGGLEAAIQEAAQKAVLGDDWQVEEYPPQRSLAAAILEQFLAADFQDIAGSPDPLTRQWLKFQKEWSVIQSLNDPRGIQALLPWNWQIE